MLLLLKTDEIDNLGGHFIRKYIHVEGYIDLRSQRQACPNSAMGVPSVSSLKTGIIDV